MGDETRESMWNIMLERNGQNSSSRCKDVLCVPEEDMRLLLHLLYQREACFTGRAQNLLQRYYVVSRKDRPCECGIVVSF